MKNGGLGQRRKKTIFLRLYPKGLRNANHSDLSIVGAEAP